MDDALSTLDSEIIFINFLLFLNMILESPLIFREKKIKKENPKYNS